MLLRLGFKQVQKTSFSFLRICFVDEAGLGDFPLKYITRDHIRRPIKLKDDAHALPCLLGMLDKYAYK
jgi:hypothetical protein